MIALSLAYHVAQSERWHPHETITKGVSLHSFSIIIANVTTLKECSE
jgi:hypothetical protein